MRGFEGGKLRRKWYNYVIISNILEKLLKKELKVYCE